MQANLKSSVGLFPGLKALEPKVLDRLVFAVRIARHQYLREGYEIRGRGMIRLFLLPGDLICKAFGLVGESEHRQVLRSYFNMMIWSAVGIGITLKIML